ncbi:MAG: ABC transporter permease [Beijerinckiaceae bacterium]|nr:ABC transporter permease [Beijerinckiaceae bacterium]
MTNLPTAIHDRQGDVLRIVFGGLWVADGARPAEQAADKAMEGLDSIKSAKLDMSSVEKLDTMGAWLVARIKHELEQRKVSVTVEGAREEYMLLLNEIICDGCDPHVRQKNPGVVDYLAEVGMAVARSGSDLVRGTAFLGDFVISLGRVILNPRRFRLTSVVNQVEKMAFRGAPIIILISLLVGAIIAQQSLFQLQAYGTSAFVADLLGILILRELAVLLTAIMMAGRSGSSITAEIGSMKMREEIDALRTMGLDPVEVLVIPRVLGLVISMPILTFISAMSGLFGGGLVAWIYGSVTPDIFLSRLQAAIGLNTFLVGMIKAPFMALVIGLIACVEGLAVKGSAESLGAQTTDSVVKSIFMVIVVDGLFAMFFAAIHY